MKRHVFVVMSVIALTMLASEVHANGLRGDALRAQWRPHYPPEQVYLNQTYTSYRPEWREDKVEVVVQRWQCKEVMEKVKVQVMVPRWNESHTVLSWKAEDQVVERRRLQWFSTPEKVMTVRRYWVMVPYTTQVNMPVLLPHYGPPVNPWGF